MFKTVLRALALAFIFALSIACIVLAILPQLAPGWVHAAVILGVTLWVTRGLWVSLRPAVQRRFLRWAPIAGVALLGASLSACSTLGGLPGAPGGNTQQFFDNLNKFNEAAAQHCAGSGNLDWNPPLPPTGSLHVQCAIGQAQMVMMAPPVAQAAAAAGVKSGSFGDATVTTPAQSAPAK